MVKRFHHRDQITYSISNTAQVAIIMITLRITIAFFYYLYNHLHFVEDMYRGSEHIEHTTQYGGEVQLLHYRVVASKFVKIKKKIARLNLTRFFTSSLLHFNNLFRVTSVALKRPQNMLEAWLW